MEPSAAPGRRPPWWGVHILVALALVGPLLPHLTERLPLGIEDTPTVPWFNLWTLLWNQRSLGHAYAGYWDAPIFHPTAGSFALSEPQPLTGLAFSAVALVVRNPVLAYNIVLIGALALAGVAGARLARRLGAPAPAAALAGVLAQCLPFVADEQGVLQLVMVFPVLFLLDAVAAWWLADAPRLRHGLAIGGWTAATFLTCGYYGIFLVPVLPLAGLVFAGRRLLTRDRLASLAVAAGVTAVVVFPVLAPQKATTDGYTRSERTLEAQSATPGNWFHLDVERPGVSVLPFLRLGDPDPNALWPGTALLVLAGFGVVAGIRDPDRRRLVAFLGVGVVVTIALSFGVHLRTGSVDLYGAVRDHVPGFRSLRSPFRFGAITQVLLVPLAALGLGALWRRPTEGLRVLLVAVVAFAGVETALPSDRTSPTPDRPPAWAAYLADHHGPADHDAVAVVPFPPDGSVESYAPTAAAMLAAIDTGHPLVNGYSGLFPASYDSLEIAMRAYPAIEARTQLRDHGVGWLVVERDWFDAAPTPSTTRSPEIPGGSLVFTDPDDGATVWRLDPDSSP